MLPTPVVIYCIQRKPFFFTFVTKTPPAAVVLLKASLAFIPGSGHDENTEKVGTVTDAQIQKSQASAADLIVADIEAMKRSIAGTARSMGLVVEG